MRHWFASGRSRSLARALREVFQDKTFDDCRCGLGIVATEYNERRQVIFKSRLQLAHGTKNTFLPGFGCLLRDAVEASCSAYPLFKTKSVAPKNQAPFCLVDGGFSANNPALLAYTDALTARFDASVPIKLLSVGTGQYPHRKPWRAALSSLKVLTALRQMDLQFSSSARTSAKVLEFVAPSSMTEVIRIDGVFAEPELAASLLEHDVKRLERLQNKGKESFGLFENKIMQLLKD